MSVPASGKRKSLLCPFNLHHKWVRRKNDVDGHQPDIIGGFAGGGGGF
jgi:hypothetical protein